MYYYYTNVHIHLTFQAINHNYNHFVRPCCVDIDLNEVDIVCDLRDDVGTVHTTICATTKKIGVLYDLFHVKHLCRSYLLSQITVGASYKHLANQWVDHLAEFPSRH